MNHENEKNEKTYDLLNNELLTALIKNYLKTPHIKLKTYKAIFLKCFIL